MPNVKSMSSSISLKSSILTMTTSGMSLRYCLHTDTYTEVDDDHCMVPPKGKNKQNNL